jgi:hypothetical protein
MFEALWAPSPETFACFLNREISMATALVKYGHAPSSLEHMSEETWNDIGLACFLLKIDNPFEVGTVFLLVSCSRERDINLFPSDPFIEVVFDLKEVRLGNYRNVNLKIKLTTVRTKAMVAIGRTSFSENSGCTTPSSSLFLNQILLIIVCIRGARNMPDFNMGSCP